MSRFGEKPDPTPADEIAAHFRSLDEQTLERDADERRNAAEMQEQADSLRRRIKRKKEFGRQKRTFGGVVIVIGCAYSLAILGLQMPSPDWFMLALGGITILVGIAVWDLGHRAITKQLREEETLD